MTNFVTGATGFIGRHLVKRLVKRGDIVWCLARDPQRATSLLGDGVQIVSGDLLNPGPWESVLSQCDVVYNLAGAVRARSTEEYYRLNHDGTRALVSVCVARAGVLRRLVHVSSLAAAGPSSEKNPLREEETPRPVSQYGKSKLLGEKEVLNARESLPVTIVRPSAVYGPADAAMVEYFRLIRHGVLPLIGWRPTFLNLIFVDDLIDGILAAAGSPVSLGQTYFLGSDTAYTIAEIGTTIAEVMRCRPVILHLPAPAVYAYGFLSQVAGGIARKPVLFNIQKVRESVQPAWTCSIEKAKLDFAFGPRISLYHGMMATYRWYVEHQWLPPEMKARE